jgi:hypothetical protein
MRLDSAVRPAVRLHAPLVQQSEKATCPLPHPHIPRHDRADVSRYIMNDKGGIISGQRVVNDLKRGSAHAMRNEMVASSREVAKLVSVLPGFPSALGCSRLLLLLVFSTSASLEETWIG